MFCSGYGRAPENAFTFCSPVFCAPAFLIFLNTYLQETRKERTAKATIISNSQREESTGGKLEKPGQLPIKLSLRVLTDKVILAEWEDCD